MGTLIANHFSTRLAFVFASGAINETSSPPVSRVYCKAKYSAFKRAQEERMKESVGKYRSTIGPFFSPRFLNNNFFGRTKFTRSSSDKPVESLPGARAHINSVTFLLDNIQRDERRTYVVS